MSLSKGCNLYIKSIWFYDFVGIGLRGGGFNKILECIS